MIVAELASKNTTLTLWVNLYAAITHAVPTDGRVRESLSPYGCTLEHNTTQGYITKAVKDATDWVNHT